MLSLHFFAGNQLWFVQYGLFNSGGAELTYWMHAETMISYSIGDVCTVNTIFRVIIVTPVEIPGY